MVALAKPDNQILDTIIQGDCLEVLKRLNTCSVDAIVTDPPAGISFMGKDWDANKGSRDIWINWLSQIMTECLRVLKPGGHALIWALPRTSHWTATAIEDAGFEIRDVLTHLFGSGFPKSHNISAAIDKHLGAEREVIGISPNSRFNSNKMYANGNGLRGHENYQGDPLTAPSTPQAQQWQGYGTALKPASEHWILARKPISEKSIAENVLRWGTGGLNIDQCRVGLEGIEHHKTAGSGAIGTQNGIYNSSNEPINRKQIARAEQGLNPRYDPQGRFPSNLLLSHSLFCVPLGTRKVKGSHSVGNPKPHQSKDGFNRGGLGALSFDYVGEDGLEEVQAWECDPSCPVYQLDLQSGIRKSGNVRHWPGQQFAEANTYGRPSRAKHYNMPASEGGASRYFQTFYYCPKASRTERNKGCEGLPVTEQQSYNHNYSDWTADARHPNGGYEKNASPPLQNNHPTVKSLSLMRYLVRLCTPPGGTVLDCFAGSGSTLVACMQEGFHFIGIEQSAEYIRIARARIAHAYGEVE